MKRKQTKTRRKYPSKKRSSKKRSSKKKSSKKRKTKWKKTKIAVATLTTIALAFGLYKWNKGRKTPDIKAAEKIINTSPNTLSKVQKSTPPIPSIIVTPPDETKKLEKLEREDKLSDKSKELSDKSKELSQLEMQNILLQSQKSELKKQKRQLQREEYITDTQWKRADVRDIDWNFGKKEKRKSVKDMKWKPLPKYSENKLMNFVQGWFWGDWDREQEKIKRKISTEREERNKHRSRIQDMTF